MATRDLAIGMIFLSQTVIGILGNFSLLYHYLFLYFTKCRLRSTDLILMHLNVANTLVLLSKGIPETMAALGLKDFLSDIGCKLLFYLHRVCRGVSMGTTCLLSVFQAITISPRDSRCAEVKVKAHKHLGTTTILCWVMTMILNVNVPVNVTGKWSNNNITNKIDYGYCSSIPQDKATKTFYVPLALVRDIFCVGLIVWASGCMVFILYQHKQQVQYIHRNKPYSRPSPEATAIQSILVLVSTFISLCILSFIFHICLIFLSNPSLWLVNTSTLIAGCFPTVSPYILMSYDSRVSRSCFAWIRNVKSP